MKKIDILPIEVLSGLIHSLAWGFFQGLWSIPSAILSMILWVLGGQISSSYRKIYIPLIICITCILGSRSYLPIISIIPLMVVLAQGWGIPTWNGPGGIQDDKGSPLGRLWWNVFKNEKKATIATRVTLAVGASLAMLPLAWVNIAWYIVGSIILILGIGIISTLK